MAEQDLTELTLLEMAELSRTHLEETDTWETLAKLYFQYWKRMELENLAAWRHIRELLDENKNLVLETLRDFIQRVNERTEANLEEMDSYYTTMQAVFAEMKKELSTL